MIHYLFGGELDLRDDLLLIWRGGWVYVIILYLFEGKLNLRYNALFVWIEGWVYITMHYLFGEGAGFTL